MIKLADYPIVFEAEQFAALRALLSDNFYASIFVLVDEHTVEYCLPILQDALKDFDPAKFALQSDVGEERKFSHLASAAD